MLQALSSLFGTMVIVIIPIRLQLGGHRLSPLDRTRKGASIASIASILWVNFVLLFCR